MGKHTREPRGSDLSYQWPDNFCAWQLGPEPTPNPLDRVVGGVNRLDNARSLDFAALAMKLRTIERRQQQAQPDEEIQRQATHLL